MHRVDRRMALCGVALLTCGLVVPAIRPARAKALADEAQLGSWLPPQVGPWRMTDPRDIVLPPRDLVTERIYSSVVARRYAAPGLADVSMVFAYGPSQDYALQLHRPEVCYEAVGFRIRSLRERELPVGRTTIPAIEMIAQRGARTDAVLFWTRIGSSFPQSVWAERGAVMASVLEDTLPDGALVRLSTSAEPQRESLAQLAAFADELVQLLPEAARVAMLGEVPV